jgi:hypothetical protein
MVFADDLQRYGIDREAAFGLIDFAWRTGQARWRNILVSYAGDDAYTIGVLSDADVRRLLGRSFYAGERCLFCLRAYGKLRTYINALGYCAYGHYEHGAYQSYQRHASEIPGPQPAFVPAPPPVPQDRDGSATPIFRDVSLAVFAPEPVAVCAVCGGNLYKPEVYGDRETDQGYAHEDDANDTHAPVLTTRAPTPAELGGAPWSALPRRDAGRV